MVEATMATYSVTSTEILSFGDERETAVQKSNEVDFIINYPKTFRGQRMWDNGTIINVSRECAEQFRDMGIGLLADSHSTIEDVSHATEILSEGLKEDVVTESVAKQLKPRGRRKKDVN